ncbi:hypothetical protein BB559_002390 [Furculomyces boomerangus]|uniref:Uncharacterized protein n=1 Tax=Furculomyces boomerangus TaxID=61424 RepID=A0A2T9YVV8_9FUNG|nr:hypothetical protein BB559_002390 [Furculomyces boomerangus]
MFGSNSEFFTSYDLEQSQETDMEVFFNRKSYNCKGDVINAVKEYHDISERSYIVVVINSLRYVLKFPIIGCNFSLKFGFKPSFKPPRVTISHLCSALDIDPTASISARHFKPSKLATINEIQSYFLVSPRSITPPMIRTKLESMRIQAKYSTYFRILEI